MFTEYGKQQLASSLELTMIGVCDINMFNNLSEHSHITIKVIIFII
jgi:hypothetical protein